MIDFTYGLEIHKCDNGARGKFIEKTRDEKGTHYRCTGCGTWGTMNEKGFVIHPKKKRMRKVVIKNGIN